ncbi:MAG: heavy metal translocating P-type ATPase, partial [Pseudomonadota bacterium]
PLTVRVTASGTDSSLSRMAALVAVAERARTRYTSLADRAARAYAPWVHILALVAFLGWLWVSQGDIRLSLNVAVAVLIITCPCALGLAVPAVMTAATGRLFRQGLLVKDGTALERLAEVDTVVFDKTGTLTTGKPVAELPDGLSADVLGVARSLGEGSGHPMAQALASALSDVPAVALDGVTECPGDGVCGLWAGTEVRLGRATWVGAEDPAERGPATWLRIGNDAPVQISFRDALRPGAADAVKALKAQGFGVMLLSGDGAAPVRDMARTLGIDDWQADVRPEDKSDVITALQTDGAKVLMVGDGLNDTVALAGAHVSLSPASALDAARVASDMVLLGQDLSVLGDALATARSAQVRIRENFAVATLYNAVAVPIALLGFATPLAAALAMSLSSISVSLNALRVR